jgi:putative endonuclease
MVVARLHSEGFEIVGRNVHVGHLELDIIARSGSLIVFCEVRARSNDQWMSPAQTITRKKIQRLRTAAGRWLSEHRPGNGEVRFDAASVVFDVPGGRIDYFEGAF